MTTKILGFINQFLDRQDGVTAIEYALIAAAIIVAIYLIVGSIGSSTSATFSSINAAI